MDEIPSPFEPPSAESAAAFPPPPPALPATSVEPTPPRRRWLAIVVAVMLVAGVVGVIAVTRGGDGAAGPSGRAVAGYSYSAAVDDAASGTANRFVLTVDGGSSGTIEISGALDGDGRMEMTADLGAELGSVKVIVDLPGGTAYFGGKTFTQMFGTDASWIAVDLSSTMDMQGLDLDALREAMSTPADIAAALADAGAEQVGLTTIDGEQFMEYAVTLTGDDITGRLDSIPIFGDRVAGDLGTLLADGIAYRVFVSETNELRRVEMTLETGGDQSVITMDLLPVAPDFVVALPDESDVEVVDLGALFGGTSAAAAITDRVRS